MAIDAYLKIDDIKGEAKDDKHKDEIDLLSWGFGISFSHDATGPMGRGGRSEFGDLSVTKTVDLASPKLYQYCSGGKPIEKATLTLQTQTGSDKIDFMKVEMEDCRVTSVSPGGAGDMPTEALSISYGTVKWTYEAIDPETGAKKGSEAAGWNVREKKEL